MYEYRIEVFLKDVDLFEHDNSATICSCLETAKKNYCCSFNRAGSVISEIAVSDLKLMQIIEVKVKGGTLKDNTVII